MRRRRDAAAAIDAAVTVGPLRLASPIVAASGTFGHGDEVLRLVDPARLGALTVKSLAAFAWEGNPAPRLHASPGGGMLNSVGLQGPGVAHWTATELPALRAAGVPVIVSLWGRTVGDFRDAAKLLDGHTDDARGGRAQRQLPERRGRGADVRALGRRDRGRRRRGRRVRARRCRSSPSSRRTPSRSWTSRGAAVAAGATGLTLVNTLLGLGIDAANRRPLLGGVTGGYSGPPLKPVALRVVHEVTRALPDVPVVGTGGVSSGTDAAEMLLAARAPSASARRRSSTPAP